MKTVFIDYSGTLIELIGPEAKTVIRRILAHSDIHEEKELNIIWNGLIKGLEAVCNDEDFMIREEIIYESFRRLQEEYHLKENLWELTDLIRTSWKHSVILPDAREFLRECPYPVYVVSNIGAPYIATCMERASVDACGIITGEIVHAYKPNPRLIEMALRLTDCKPEDAIHIGDNYHSDVLIPSSHGIKSYLIDRHGTIDAPDTCKISSLTELLKII